VGLELQAEPDVRVEKEPEKLVEIDVLDGGVSPGLRVGTAFPHFP
jgi:hypothetical protein